MGPVMDDRDWEELYEYEAKVLATLLKQIDPTLPFNEMAGKIYNHLAQEGGLDEPGATSLGKVIRELGYI